jgi:hypothetical protein
VVSLFGMSGCASDARVSCAMTGHEIVPASCTLWVCRSCYAISRILFVTAQTLQDLPVMISVPVPHNQSTTRPSECDSRHCDPLNDGTDMSGEIRCLGTLLIYYQYGAGEFMPTVNGGLGAISSSGKSRDVIGRSTGPTVDYRSVDRSMRCGYVQRRGRRALRNDGQFSRAHYVS